MPLLTVAIPLDRRPFLPGERFPVILSREVPEVRQTGDHLCWAACIAAVKARAGKGGSLAEIAAQETGRPSEECREDPVDKRCDVPVDPDQLERAWRQNGFPGVHFRDGTIAEDELKDHLAKHGPVQIAFGNEHLVMLDHWAEGVFGTILVRFMDPMTGVHIETTEHALRTDPADDGRAAWTGTVTGLEA